MFPSAFRPDAAAAVWGAPDLDAAVPLDQLVSRSLLGFEQETNRYRLHDLVRTVAGEGLDSELRLEAEARHAEHYCAVLARADELYLSGGSDMLGGLALFDEERTNILVGQAWSALHRDAHAGAARLTYEYTNAGAYVLEHPAANARPDCLARRRRSRLPGARRAAR